MNAKPLLYAVLTSSALTACGGSTEPVRPATLLVTNSSQMTQVTFRIWDAYGGNDLVVGNSTPGTSKCYGLPLLYMIYSASFTIPPVSDTLPWENFQPTASELRWELQISDSSVGLVMPSTVVCTPS